MAFDYLDIKEAEKIANKRLDRRMKYFIWSGDLCTSGTYRSPCSGCSDDTEGVMQSVGAGCRECGYHGVRIGHYPCPVTNPSAT